MFAVLPGANGPIPASSPQDTADCRRTIQLRTLLHWCFHVG